MKGRMANKKKPKAKPKKKAAPKKATPPRKSAPRTPRLPGMEDAKIEALEQVALDYAEIRDERMKLSSQEIDLKGKIIDLMHANKKTAYTYDNVSIVLTVEKEKVKVKIAKESDAAGEDVDVEVEREDPDHDQDEDEGSESGEEDFS